MRWYLGAATIATLLMAPLWFYFFESYFSPELRMGSEVMYFSLTTSAFIAYPMVIAFWLIARPDRYAEPLEPAQAAG